MRQAVENENGLYVIECNKNDDGKYFVTFSNGETETFSEDEVMEHCLYDISVPLNCSFEDLVIKIKKRRALKSIVGYVARTLRTEREVRERLLFLGYNDAVIEETVAYLKTQGYIDDREYARKYVNTSLKTKVESRKMCEYKLIQKGIPENIAEEAVRVIDDGEQIQKLMQKKSVRQKEMKKLRGFLYSKGFDIESINRVLGDDSY